MGVGCDLCKQRDSDSYMHILVITKHNFQMTDRQNLSKQNVHLVYTNSYYLLTINKHIKYGELTKQTYCLYFFLF